MSIISIPTDIFNKDIVKFIIEIDDVFVNNISLKKYEFYKLRKIYYIFNLIPTCKYFYNKLDNDDFWRIIMISIYPKNYKITDKSIHIKKKEFYTCYNRIYYDYDLINKKEEWINKGKPCYHVDHYEYSTLEYKYKYDNKKNFNFKKIILKKLRTYLNNGSFIEYKDICGINLNNINKRIECAEKELKCLYRMQKLQLDKDKLLKRLNYSIDNKSVQKYNSYINFIEIQKKKSNYNFTESIKLWKNMSKVEKDKYKSI